MTLADLLDRVLAPWIEVPARLSRMEDLMAVNQADLDAITSNLRSLRAELTDDNSRIQQALADLAAANPNLDLSEVNAALSDLAGTVDSTSAIVPATPGDGGTPQPGTDPGAGTGDAPAPGQDPSGVGDGTDGAPAAPVDPNA